MAVCIMMSRHPRTSPLVSPARLQLFLDPNNRFGVLHRAMFDYNLEFICDPLQLDLTKCGRLWCCSQAECQQASALLPRVDFGFGLSVESGMAGCAD